jgi:hypothetical protein
MAAVPITPVTADRAGGGVLGTGTLATAGTPFTFTNGGNQVVRIKWTAAETSLTIAIPAGPDGTTSPGKVVPLASTGDTIIGPFPTAVYGTTVSMSGPVLGTTTLWVLQFVPTS